TSLPTEGTLLHNGVPVQIGDTFTGADAVFSYAPGVGREGAGSDAFTFVVTDTGDPAGSQGNALTSSPATVSIDIVTAVAPGTVPQDGNGVVRIGGTDGDDDIVISAQDGYLLVLLNGTVLSDNIPLGSITEVRAWGYAGNDDIAVIDLALATMLSGGAGN